MLSVSKPVNWVEITEYPADKRFLKLPIENYLKLMPSPDGDGTVFDKLNRPQIAMINAVNDPRYRFIVAAYSRRLGKTFIANIIGQVVVLMPGANVLIMSPNYTLSSISFELQRRFIRHFEVEVAKDNVKDKIIELENGSTIRMGSIKTVDSCVGRSYDLIIFDEAALGEDAENAFNVSLRPTLDKPNSKAIFISTPRGKLNWFSRFYDRGWSKEEKYSAWISMHADYTENDRMKEEDVEEARATMSKAEFEQEYMASFTVFEGQIFKYDSEKNTREFEPRDEVQFIGGLDPGYKDPTAFIVIAYYYDPDILDYVYHVVDEYQDNQSTTKAHAARLSELIAKWNVDPIFIDSAAAQFAADLAYEYDIATVKANKAKLEGIAKLQTLVEQDRFRVAPHCTTTLAMLDQYRWDTRETLKREEPIHDDHSHMADAARYAVYTFVI